MDFSKPTIEYAQLWPMLVVFGVACLGVLVEAFVPRERRYLTQAALAVAGLAVALGWLRLRLHRPQGAQARRRRRGPRQARRRGHAGGRRPVGLHLGAGAGLRDRRRAALRRAPARGRGLGVRRPGRGAARHRGRARGVDPGPRPHRGLPAADVRGRRHDALPDRQRPAHDVRGARGALAAALPALRPGPPAPAAQPGGRAQVLPARRVLLRLLPLRRRADLRVRRLHAVRRHQRGGPQRHLATPRCC